MLRTEPGLGAAQAHSWDTSRDGDRHDRIGAELPPSLQELKDTWLVTRQSPGWRDPGLFVKENAALCECCLPHLFFPQVPAMKQALGKILIPVSQMSTPGWDTQLRSECSGPLLAKLILEQASNHRMLFRAINMKMFNFPGVLRSINHVFKGL